MEILISVLIGLILMEIYAWLDPLAKWLVHRVAKNLPDGREAEFSEQFLADLATLPNSIVKVFYALRDCTLSARSIYDAEYRNALTSMTDEFDDALDIVASAKTILDESILRFETE